MRIEGWEKRLDEYIQSMALREFVWGECDCLIFACDAAVTACGKDPMSYKLEGDPDTIRNSYKTELGAARLIKKYRDGMAGIMDVHFQRKPVAFAQRGDIVLADVKGRETFGVVWSGKAFFKMENKGLMHKPVADCKLAWSVE